MPGDGCGAGGLETPCQDDLGQAIATGTGRYGGDVTARAVARPVLEIPDLAGHDRNRLAALDAVIGLLRHGLPTETHRSWAHWRVRSLKPTSSGSISSRRRTVIRMKVILWLFRGRSGEATVYCEIGHFTSRALVRARRGGSSAPSTAAAIPPCP